MEKVKLKSPYNVTVNTSKLKYVKDAKKQLKNLKVR
jgi:hypothetical protein